MLTMTAMMMMTMALMMMMTKELLVWSSTALAISLFSLSLGTVKQFWFASPHLGHHDDDDDDGDDDDHDDDDDDDRYDAAVVSSSIFHFVNHFWDANFLEIKISLTSIIASFVMTNIVPSQDMVFDFKI